MASRRMVFFALIIGIALVVSACNLSGAPSEEQIAQTATAAATGTGQPTRTPLSTSGAPTTVPVTRPTNLPTFSFPTAIVSVPTRLATSVPPPVIPTSSTPVSIAILSPVPGNVVAGNVQVIGSASHPQFLQYQVEFGPDPNPGNLWFPATSAITTPVLNGILGIWNTNTVQDSRYQLRLRVYLRDGTVLTTVNNNITVQNRVPTPVPSPTQAVARPIAAFNLNPPGGDAPLTVQFTNQSSGVITSLSWNFGDGSNSAEVNPRHTYGSPGLYTVTLTVNGPGGASNVARQINVTSPTAPVAAFSMTPTTGLAPLTVQFTNQSTGNISSYQWFFSDGSTSALPNPSHTFTNPGTYNVFLTVAGPGGASSATHQLVVNVLVSPTYTPSLTFTPTFTPSFTPTFTETFTPTFTTTVIPPTLTFTPTNTETPTFTPTFTETPTNTTTVVPPTETFTATNTETPTNTTIPPTLTFTPTNTETPTETPIPPSATNTEFPPPQANFVANTVSDNTLAVQFTSTSTGQIAQYAWQFGDGGTSSEVNPAHIYGSGGTYTVTLTVTDTLNRTSTFSGAVSVSELVNAGFTFTVSDLKVDFTDQSTGSVTSYLWQFGDGGTSNEVSPSYTYNAPGTYTVTLTVSEANGRSDSESQQVEVNAPIQAVFSPQPNNLTVAFVNQSTGPVVASSWQFGDGGTSTEANPTYTYSNPGTYEVTLMVSDAGGATDSTSQQVTVAAPIQAGFAAQPNNLEVTFTDQSTGPVTGYVWQFGDGGTSNEASPSYTYNAPGTYTVTLTVSDANGRSDSESQQVEVNAPIQAAFSPQPNNLTVAFVNQSTGPVVASSWQFGDGGTSNEASPTYTYTAPGTYTVTLTVSNASGGVNSTSQQVAVSAPIQAAFTPQVNNLTVAFVNQSTGPVTASSWNFGDGGTSTEANPTYTYSNPGTYEVTLTVSDAGGATDSTSQQVTVAAPIQAGFAAQPNNLEVNFTDQSTGSVTSYLWQFGDGGTSDQQNPTYTYNAPGTYTVTLTVSDASGGSNSTSQQVTVSAPVEANFTAQATDLTVQFTSQSTGDVAQYNWSFGDGESSTEENPSHTYASPGSYSVTLIVTSSGGTSDDQSQVVEVAAPLQANFAAQPNNLDVQFTDQSTGAVTSYLWQFGDGGTSDQQNPTYTYASGGTYTVTLTVSDASGRSSDHSSEVTVSAPPSEPTQPPPQESLVDTTPIQPDFAPLHDFLRGIYANGINSSTTRATVFAVAGDSVFTANGILSPFATNQYSLGGNDVFQPIIDWFNSTDLGGTTSFNRVSLAVNPNWTAAQLLDPAQANPSCNGEAPLLCELHQTMPVLMFVSIGRNDALNGTDSATFQNTLNQIVSTIISNGTIPVLLTVPDDSSIPNLAAINDAIITVAQANNVPLLNVARALNQLPSENFDASPSGAGDLSEDAVGNYGINRVNIRLLRVLNDARTIIFPDA